MYFNFKYRTKTVNQDQCLPMSFSSWLLSFNINTAPLGPPVTHSSSQPSNQDDVCTGGGQGVRRDPADNPLPIDFGSRFLTNSVWSPTCRMLYTLLFISSSWLYLRYCVTFSETNTTLPSRFTTKKNPSRA